MLPTMSSLSRTLDRTLVAAGLTCALALPITVLAIELLPTPALAVETLAVETRAANSNCNRHLCPLAKAATQTGHEVVQKVQLASVHVRELE